MSYTPVFQKPYPDGWENLPSEDTPITAEALDGYDEAIVNIEGYLEDNEIISVEANPQDASTDSLTKIKIGGTVYSVLGGGGASSLNDLSDVTITSASQGQVLIRGASNWENANLTKSNVGLGNVDNTSDLNKPISTATQNALDAKADKNSLKITSFNVTTTGWDTDTTSQSGRTLYKKEITLNHIYVESPSVDIGSSGVLPTLAEQTAYDLVQYVTVDDTVPCLYLYASDIPTDAFYINVEGVD